MIILHPAVICLRFMANASRNFHRCDAARGFARGPTCLGVSWDHQPTRKMVRKAGITSYATSPPANAEHVGVVPNTLQQIADFFCI